MVRYILQKKKIFIYNNIKTNPDKNKQLNYHKKIMNET